jgi:hypothetical protein
MIMRLARTLACLCSSFEIANAIQPLKGGVMAVVESQPTVFSGKGNAHYFGGKGPMFLNTVWSLADTGWSLSNDGSGETPSARWKSAGDGLMGALDYKSPNNETFQRPPSLAIFGGVTESLVRLDDLWLFQPDTKKWQEITGFSGLQPSPREAHTATTYLNSLYVLGGRSDEKAALEDFWKITVVDSLNPLSVLQPTAQEWSSLTPIPVGRRGHAAANGNIVLDGVAKDCLMVFGGRFGSEKYLNDLWVYSYLDDR